MSEHHVVIIGGGITGLVAAYQLRKLHDAGILPIHCTVIEQDHRLGGKIHTRKTEQYLLELGPDSIYTRKPAGIEFLHELGLTDEIVPVNPRGGTFVWHHHRLQPLPPGVNTGVPTDLGAFAKTQLLSMKGKLRALADLVLPFEPYPADIALGKLLRKRLGDEVVDLIASPLLAGIHAGDIDRLSLDATMPMWRTLYEKHRSLIIGALSQKKKVVKRPTIPAEPMFINLKGGLEQLIERTVTQIRDFADLRTETRAMEIIKSNLNYTIKIMEKGATSYLQADAVILATPAFAAAEILSPLGVSVEHLQSIRYASTATISLGYNRAFALPISGSGYLVPRTEGSNLTACTIISNKWSHASKQGNLLIRCYVGRDGQEEALKWDDEHLLKATLEELKESMGIPESPDFVEIKRWMSSMPQYDVGHLDRLRQIDQDLVSFPGIYLAGAAYRGLGIPDCIKDAKRVVEQLEHDLLNSVK